MKHVIYSVCILLLFLRIPANGQEDERELDDVTEESLSALPQPSPGNALVIFTRPLLDAPAVLFEYFDSEQFLGKIGVRGVPRLRVQAG